MQKFAQLLNNLYFTYSNLAKTELLKNYFLTVPDPERGYGLAILAGTLTFPTFKWTMIKDLLNQYIDPVLFSLSYDYVGDLSDTIALLWPNQPSNKSLPLLSEIIQKFNQLPEEEIASWLNELLNRSNTNERWALIKIGTGSLRVGVSARFIKNALAKYGRVDVKEIEHVWHALKPPYIDLFAWLEGSADYPRIDEQIFYHPVMLSHPLSEKELASLELQQFAVERKFDGIRVQLICTESDKRLFTRTGEDISHSFPDILSEIKGQVVLDGELVIRNQQNVGSFNELQQRLNRKKPTKELISKFPAAIVFYDLLSIQGRDIRSLDFMERRLQLESWYKENQNPCWFLSELLDVDKDNIFAVKERILAEKQVAVEGLMLKHKASPYIAGRPKGYWYKWKRDPMLVDAVLMYAQRGHGKRSSFYSDYTFGLWVDMEVVPIGKAYFGFTDKELYELDQWIRHHTIQRFGPVREVEKKLVFEVAFDEVRLSARHKSGLALRFPRIHRIRWDKPAEEADTLESLKQFIRF
ncbi:ATP dependent DNA ligase [Legionella birminghamensis]|uniref:DNA ligase (ATP) n=1 Tax=Legionella birminghamensis TaxID=28083 RepID=A0A378IHN4_9GAMM|nr:cisplatin damage response ATP-dependent DNA ligase [Legionella birminghamensis]KTC74391.1 ATP dependent DNA ligase [Legionella birminghamensis]STX31694.1 Putative DNA ligase-like protein Rv0938/MT0965 [Legionella birminghamensis]